MYQIFSIDTKKVKVIKIYCIVCNKYKQFKNPKISFIFKKTLRLSIVCSKCGNEDKKYLKKKNEMKILF